ncbi:MAG: hypothetical protein DHS20C08_15870 [Rhodomicrobium sp.]|nr:MAG: hypothetical protein DHS20C08_15870 [Rhodomicrobium sp.]
MNFAGLNWMAIFVAAVAGYAFGAVWYMAFAKPWMSAAGLSDADVQGDGSLSSKLPFLYAMIANLVLAFTMAGLMAHMVVDLRHGLITAGFIWGGFVFPVMLVNNSFQKRPFRLTLIDAGHWLGVLLIISAVIGAFGVS